MGVTQPTCARIDYFFADWLFWFISVSTLETCITDELKCWIIMASKPFNLYILNMFVAIMYIQSLIILNSKALVL